MGGAGVDLRVISRIVAKSAENEANKISGFDGIHIDGMPSPSGRRIG